ncbi:MAG: ribosome maturation factor RimP [Thermoanaerobaculia bacterium]|nr:ribosome maturation factor RimP [Thermoanaerobaculia bacterium]
MANSSIDPELRSELAAIAESQGCELLEVSFDHGNLRLVLDREEGSVTLDDCQAVSKQASPLLDVHDFGHGKYTLEVSSPGLDRKLYGPRDYRRFSEHLVRVTFLSGPERAKRTVVGRLVGYDEEVSDGGVLHVQEASAGKPAAKTSESAASSAQRIEIPVADVQLARLEVEF